MSKKKEVLILDVPDVIYDPNGEGSVCKLCNAEQRLENCKDHVLQKHLTTLLQNFMKHEILDAFKNCFKEFYKDLNHFTSHFVKKQNGEIFFKTGGQFCFMLTSKESKVVYRSIPKDVFTKLVEQPKFETITIKDMFRIDSFCAMVRKIRNMRNV